ncbi:DUF7518 family protein [Haloarcula litorea]|uniref:DUF7518 family protein n=1 Tax=Haloarcula litorea TaxID=3032579 RepID=UPI0023E83AE3|nr:hypothetical protein [Halomicroarcula sp. GDY20]
MCGNRVEELEERVKELEASVEGLTDELVECKVRLRELENTVDEESGFGADARRDSAESSETEPDTEAEQSGESDDGGDIIVPETGADTTNTPGPEGADKEDEAASESAESETDDDSGSDIIVA